MSKKIVFEDLDDSFLMQCPVCHTLHRFPVKKGDFKPNEILQFKCCDFFGTPASGCFNEFKLIHLP